MDKSRVLRWTQGALESFDDLARAKLLELKLIKEETPISTNYVLSNFPKISAIRRLSVECALMHEGGDVDAVKAIDAYLEKGGDLGKLEQAVYEAFLVATDPSYIPIWKETFNIPQEIMEEAIRIATAKVLTKKAKGARGGRQPGSA